MRRKKRRNDARLEHDTLGALRVPADAYYGVQTQRAVLNFPVSGRRLPPVFVVAYARIKKAAAEANRSLGRLDRRRATAIGQAASEILAGRHLDQFVVDVFQAGAGTSQNMNLNEVLANRAIEILGGRRGDYSVVHPNDHVNMSQSTNDTFPAAMRIAILMSLPALERSLSSCRAALSGLGTRFRRIVKAARTHLQDAVPITLGQEFAAYAAIVARATARVRDAAHPLHRLNLGATAAGTGLNAHARYSARVTRLLARDTGLPFRPAENLVEVAMSTADFAAFSSSLRDLALDLGRIANDLRLMASGPTTGLSEIDLPALQPGSSIMPGKVNPVLCEMLNMVCFHVVGLDQSVASASAAGQFELNVMTPVIIHEILEAMTILTSAVDLFARRCLSGVRANAERCRRYFESSPALVTALTPTIGYARAAEIAQESIRSGRTIGELLREKGILPPRLIRRVLDPARLTRPGVLQGGRGSGLRPGKGGAGRSSPGRRG